MVDTSHDGDRVLRNVARVDFGTVRDIERTPIGGLRIDAAITRSGVLVYRDTNGAEFREFVPPSEVFSVDSLATMRDIPVTDGHPSALVTPQSYRSVSRGHVADTARQDGDLACAPLVIDDAALCTAIESHERKDVSAGYTCDIDPTPGTFEGAAYDRVQRNRRYNHVAVLPPGAGRAGPEVSLRMDGAAFQVRADGAREHHVNVKPITFRGREYKFDEAAGNFGTLEKDVASAGKTDADAGALDAKFEAVQQALADAMSQIAQLKAQLQAATAMNATEEAAEGDDVEPEPDEVLDSRAARRVISRAVAPGAKLKGMRADAVRALVSASIDKIATARAEEIAKVRSDASKVLVEADMAGKSVDQIRRAVLAKLSPEVKMDAVDAKTIAFAFDAALAAAKPVTAPAPRRDAGNAAIRAVIDSPRTDAEDTSLEALYAKQNIEYLARGRAVNGSK